MSEAPVLLLFRRDLRVRDHPALSAAADRDGPVIPVYILDDGEASTVSSDSPDWRIGSAQRWWIHHSLLGLDASLRERGSKLVFRCGATFEELRELANETGASEIFWSHRYDAIGAEADRRIRSSLADAGLAVRAFGGSLLHDPDALRTGAGEHYKVFTPFYRRFLEVADIAADRPAPKRVPAPSRWPRSIDPGELRLLPAIDWAEGFVETGTPGETAAVEQLRSFAASRVEDYADLRDQLAEDATSKVSPRLAVGELSPRQVWNAVREAAEGEDGPGARGRDAFLRQLVWREFSYHILHHNPDAHFRPLRGEFAAFPWRDENGLLEAWQRGRTGYPVVDAAMRQLWTTGWMHNRARMVVASFLTKHLRLHWLHGARWFWDTLVDADLANNSMGWQWSAGSGADAQPYFRIFNPILQGRKFDAGGTFVRRWVPELAGLPDSVIHEPWHAPEKVLREAGVRLGDTYPQPLVEHAGAREAALAAYEVVKGRARLSAQRTS